MEFFDSHAHYNDGHYNEDRDNLINTMLGDGITRLVCAGYNVASSIEAINIAKKYDHIYATCGISPNDIEDFSEENLKKIEELAKNEKVVAIGEIGYDYYWNKDKKDIQKEYFSKQIEIANRLNLPIVIHSRDAYIDTIDMIRNISKVNKKGIFHCCQLNQELIKNAVNEDFYISFSGNITYKNAKSDECIKLVPLDKILIETDSPYLSPEPLRGTRNNSANVKLVAKKISEVLNMELGEIASITYENANRIFNI